MTKESKFKFIDLFAGIGGFAAALTAFGGKSVYSVEIDKEQTIVTIVGNEIAQTASVLKKLFDAIDEVPVTMVSYGGSSHNISLLLPSTYKTKTLQLINRGLFNL